MCSLFQSPAQEAQAVAGAEAQQLTGMLGNSGTTTIGAPGGGAAGAAGLPSTTTTGGAGLEGYAAAQEQNLRGGIAGIGANPYFEAAAQMQPSKINPNDAVTFASTPGPGAFNATPQVGGAQTAGGLPLPPPLPPSNVRTPQPVARTPNAQ